MITIYVQGTDDEVTPGARLWHPWLRIQRLLRDTAGGSAQEPAPWRAVQRAAWEVLNKQTR